MTLTSCRYAHTYYNPEWMTSHGYSEDRVRAAAETINTIATDASAAKAADSWLEVIRRPPSYTGRAAIDQLLETAASARQATTMGVSAGAQLR